jgi:hypothetical protein
MIVVDVKSVGDPSSTRPFSPGHGSELAELPGGPGIFTIDDDTRPLIKSCSKAGHSKEFGMVSKKP